MQKVFASQNSVAAGKVEVEQPAEKLTDVGPRATGSRRPPLPARMRQGWIPTRKAQKPPQQLKRRLLRFSLKAKKIRTNAESIFSSINTSADPDTADTDVICCEEPDRCVY